MELDDLAPAVDRFLRHLTERKSAPNTLAAYQTDLAQFLQFAGAQHDSLGKLVPTGAADEIGPELVSSFVFSLRERGYAPSTIARRIAAVKSFFAYAEDSGLLTRNPAANLEAPRVTRPAPRGVSASEVQMLIDIGCSGETPDALRNRALLTLLHETGLRVSELVALDVDSVDLARGSIQATGRTGRSRSIPLAPASGTALEAYLSSGRPTLARGNGEAALFLNNRGARLTRQGFWLIIRTRAHRSGVIGPVSPHALRNSFAFERLASGTGLKELKELLGHVSIATTRVYARSNGRTASSGGSEPLPKG